MQLKYFIFVVGWTSALAVAAQTAFPKDERNYFNDENDFQSKNFNRFGELTFGSSDYSTNTARVDSYGDHSVVNYGVPSVSPPSFGVAVNTKGILAPHVEILHLVEAFVKLTAEVVARYHALITENWEPIKTLVNLIFSKIQKLNIIFLKGIGVVRTIIEFAFKLFSNWSFTLPSLTLGSIENTPPQFHETYGVSANIANFLDAMKTL